MDQQEIDGTLVCATLTGAMPSMGNWAWAQTVVVCFDKAKETFVVWSLDAYGDTHNGHYDIDSYRKALGIAADRIAEVRQ